MMKKDVQYGITEIFTSGRFRNFYCWARRGDEELRRAVVSNKQKAQEIISEWKEGK